MANTRSRQPKQGHQRPNPPGYYSAPLEDLHDGKLFRVRDDNDLFGFEMTWAEAFKLKDKIAGRKISTTVLIEEMDDEDTPDWVLAAEGELAGQHAEDAVAAAHKRRDDDNLEELRASAKRAAAGAAQSANGRHAARAVVPPKRPIVAARTIAPTPSATSRALAGIAPVPVVQQDEDLSDIDPNDLTDGLGEIPDDASIAAELAAMETDGTTDA